MQQLRPVTARAPVEHGKIPCFRPVVGRAEIEAVVEVLRSAWLAAARYLAVPLLLYILAWQTRIWRSASVPSRSRFNAFANVVPHRIKTDTEWRSR